MSSTSVFQSSVLTVLRELELAVAAVKPPAPNPGLRMALARLEDLTATLPADVPPDLRHYLLKRSYQKARVWLEGGDPEAGACPR